MEAREPASWWQMVGERRVKDGSRKACGSGPAARSRWRHGRLHVRKAESPKGTTYRGHLMAGSQRHHHKQLEHPCRPHVYASPNPCCHPPKQCPQPPTHALVRQGQVRVNAGTQHIQRAAVQPRQALHRSPCHRLRLQVDGGAARGCRRSVRPDDWAGGAAGHAWPRCQVQGGMVPGLPPQIQRWAQTAPAATSCHDKLRNATSCPDKLGTLAAVPTCSYCLRSRRNMRVSR